MIGTMIHKDGKVTAINSEDTCRICKTNNHKDHGQIVFNTTIHRYHLDCIMDKLDEVMNKLENT